MLARKEKDDMTQQYDVFISYSHLDSQLANSIYSKLNNAGLRCFLAEKDIAASELWEDKIRESLRSSHRILLLITPNSKNSPWVVAEAGAAWALGKQLIPALAYVKTDELITPISSHQARLVHTPEQIEKSCPRIICRWLNCKWKHKWTMARSKRWRYRLFSAVRGIKSLDSTTWDEAIRS